MMFSWLFGPSIYLLILDMFLDNPTEFINLREVSRRVDKNPGSISRVLPRLVERGFLEQIQVGKATYAYRLNTVDPLVRILQESREKLQELQRQREQVKEEEAKLDD